MTEAEWQASTTLSELLALARGRDLVTPRKARLLAAAICRRSWARLEGPERDGVVAAEAMADGVLDGQAPARAVLAVRFLDPHRPWPRRAASRAVYLSLEPPPRDPPVGRISEFIAVAGAERGGGWLARTRSLERQAHAALARDVLDNPWRPARVEPAWLAWGAGTVPALARAIDEDRAFDRLPVLADALEEAGCAEVELLAHLRGPGPHVRGCWALDLILADAL